MPAKQGLDAVRLSHLQTMCVIQPQIRTQLVSTPSCSSHCISCRSSQGPTQMSLLCPVIPYPVSVTFSAPPPVVFLCPPPYQPLMWVLLRAHHHCMVSAYLVSLALPQVRLSVYLVQTSSSELGWYIPVPLRLPGSWILTFSCGWKPEFCMGMGLINLFSQVVWCVLTWHVPLRYMPTSSATWRRKCQMYLEKKIRSENLSSGFQKSMFSCSENTRFPRGTSLRSRPCRYWKSHYSVTRRLGYYNSLPQSLAGHREYKKVSQFNKGECNEAIFLMVTHDDGLLWLKQTLFAFQNIFLKVRQLAKGQWNSHEKEIQLGLIDILRVVFEIEVTPGFHNPRTWRELELGLSLKITLDSSCSHTVREYPWTGSMLSTELGLWTQHYFSVFSKSSAERLVVVASNLILESPISPH